MPFKTKAQLAEEAAGRPPDFMEFREKFFARENFWYHHDAWRAIERNNRLIMLLPPGSTKTMTWSIEQAAYRLMFDRNFRILTIQKSAEEAVKVLGAVQERLSNKEFYTEVCGLQEGYDPITMFGPFKPSARYRGSSTWGADHFRVQGFSSGEKDYSMQAKGAGSASLSVRSDLIVLDDIQEPRDDTPAGTDKLLRWLQQAVLTRVYPEQKVVILGSRLGPTDIYARLLEDPEFEDWPVVKYPAVMDACRACLTKKRRRDGVILCRHAEKNRMLVPELKDHTGKVVWNYKGLVKRRKEAGPNVWATSYMMQEGDFRPAIFKKDSIEACKHLDYAIGEVPPQVTDVFVGVDPAISAYCAMVVWGLDRRTGVRFLIDVFNRRDLRTFGNIQKEALKLVTRYGAKVLAIEKANVQESLTNDPEFIRDVRAVGCRLTTYQTRTAFGARAENDDFDVSSIGDLFDSKLIVLPDRDEESHAVARPYVDQLLDWRPGIKHLTRDMVMATLFAESEAREFYLRFKNRKGETRTSEAPQWVKERKNRWKKSA